MKRLLQSVQYRPREFMSLVGHGDISSSGNLYKELNRLYQTASNASRNFTYHNSCSTRALIGDKADRDYLYDQVLHVARKLPYVKVVEIDVTKGDDLLNLIAKVVGLPHKLSPTFTSHVVNYALQERNLISLFIRDMHLMEADYMRSQSHVFNSFNSTVLPTFGLATGTEKLIEKINGKHGWEDMNNTKFCYKYIN